MRDLLRLLPVRGALMMRLVVLSGLAGVGKSELLACLATVGEHAVDLEQLAAHRGSAFGGLGRPPQPSQRDFTMAVESAMTAGAPDRPTWIEDEGPFLGSLAIPRDLQAQLASADVVEVMASRAARVARLVETYGHLDRGLLVRATKRLRSRLGDERTRLAVTSFRSGDPAAAIDVLLPYFDRGYEHRVRMFRRRCLTVVDLAQQPLPSLIQVTAPPDKDPRPPR